MTAEQSRGASNGRPEAGFAGNRNWLIQERDGSTNAPALVCLPHAGCGASAFANTAKQFLQGTQAYIYQYPARETRLVEQPATSLKDLASRIANELPPQLGHRPFTIFGHSMGARLGYEIARELLARDTETFLSLAVSCSPAPTHARPIDPSYKGTNADFVSYLRRLGGMPAELLEVEELMDLLLPTLRADFAMLDAYIPSSPSPALSCPINVFYSPEDNSTNSDEIRGWANLSTLPVSFHELKGGHFYFSSQNQTLAEFLAGGSQ